MNGWQHVGYDAEGLAIFRTELDPRAPQPETIPPRPEGV